MQYTRSTSLMVVPALALGTWAALLAAPVPPETCRGRFCEQRKAVNQTAERGRFSVAHGEGTARGESDHLFGNGDMIAAGLRPIAPPAPDHRSLCAVSRQPRRLGATALLLVFATLLFLLRRRS